MKVFKQIAAGLALLLAIAGPVVAQTATPQAGGARQGRGQGRGGQVSAATMPIGTLDYVVTLKEDQKTKITEIQAKLKDEQKAAAGDNAKRRELSTKAVADIDAILTDEQKAKLKEHTPGLRLLAQSRAIPLAVLPDVKLTAEQRDKLKDSVKETTEKLAALPRGATSQAERQTLLDAFKAKVDSVLTDVQKKIIADKTAKKAAPPAP